MKRFFVIFILMTVVSITFAQENDWRASAKYYVSDVVDPILKRHAADIEALEVDTNDFELQLEYERLRSAFYSANVQLSRLKTDEKLAKTVEKKKEAHERVLNQKKRLDEAAAELFKFVNGL